MSFRRTSWAWVIVILWAASPRMCAGDIYYEQVCQLTAAGQSGPVPEPKRMRVYVSKGKVRVEDLSASKTVIVRLDKGVIWGMDEKDKTYTEVSLKEFSEQWRAQRERAGVDEKGGKVETERGKDNRIVAGYECAHYIIREAGRPVLEVWCTEELDVPEKKDLFDYSERLGEFSRNVLSAARKLKGFPMRMKATKYVGASRVEVFRELLLLEQEPVDPAKFEVPEDYHKLSVFE